MMTRFCFRCRIPRPESELLRVTTVGTTKPPFYICRPSIGNKGCFTWVGRASVHRIELAAEGLDETSGASDVDPVSSGAHTLGGRRL